MQHLHDTKNDHFWPVCHPGESPGLDFLLDTLDATELAWRELPGPAPLFVEEVRSALLEALGFPQGVD